MRELKSSDSWSSSGKHQPVVARGCCFRRQIIWPFLYNSFFFALIKADWLCPATDWVFLLWQEEVIPYIWVLEENIEPLVIKTTNKTNKQNPKQRQQNTKQNQTNHPKYQTRMTTLNRTRQKDFPFGPKPSVFFEVLQFSQQMVGNTISYFSPVFPVPMFGI